MGRPRSLTPTRSSSSTCSSSSAGMKESQQLHRDHSDRKKSARKNCIRKRSCKHHKPGLEILTEKIHKMVTADQKRSRTGSCKRAAKDSSICGCPYNCGEDLQKLRQEISEFYSEFSDGFANKPVQQLEHFLNDCSRLLSEAWTSIGLEKVLDLVSSNLLSTCVRRERRAAKHESHKLKPSSSIPFDVTQIKPGLSELWQRCLYELNQLSDDQILNILNGSLTFDPAESSNSIDLASNHQSDTLRSQIGSPPNVVLSKSVHPADSTTNMFMTSRNGSRQSSHDSLEVQPESNVTVSKDALTDTPEQSRSNLVVLVHQEITELEMRARAIRSMLKIGCKLQLDK